MKKITQLLLTVLLTVVTGITVSAQESNWDDRYEILVSTTQRDVPGKLFIKNGSGNTFSGLMVIDNDERDVFGWYTKKISEGGGFVYNTNGIEFYVRLNNAGFQHQQLFRAIYNFDGTCISGTFFYWGNEFNFTGRKIQEVVIVPEDTIANPSASQITVVIDGNLSNLISVSPNPADGTIAIGSDVLNLQNLNIEIYSISGVFINRYDLYSNFEQIDISTIPSGEYVIKVFSDAGTELGTIKLIKN